MERPRFAYRRFSWPGIGDSCEFRWVGVTPGETEIPFQVGGTCCHHALTTTTTTNYCIEYDRRGLVVPFDRLSVQYAVDRSNKSVSESEAHSKQRALEVFESEGILAVEHYCAGGKRGELQWKPRSQLPNRPRYRVTIKDIPQPHLEESIVKVKRELARGPVYAEFSFRVEQYKKDGKTVVPHDGLLLKPTQIDNDRFSSHSVCIFGHGSFRSRFNNEVISYYVYRNTYGDDWGDRGWGRIRCNAVSTILVLRVPRHVPELNLGHLPDSIPFFPPLDPAPPPPFTDCSRFTEISRATSSSSQGGGGSSHTGAPDLKRKHEMNTVCPRKDTKSDESGVYAQALSSASERLTSNTSEPLLTTGDALDKYQIISEKESGVYAQSLSSASERLTSNTPEPLLTTGDALDKYQIISEKLLYNLAGAVSNLSCSDGDLMIMEKD